MASAGADAPPSELGERRKLHHALPVSLNTSMSGSIASVSSSSSAGALSSSPSSGGYKFPPHSQGQGHGAYGNYFQSGSVDDALVGASGAVTMQLAHPPPGQGQGLPTSFLPHVASSPAGMPNFQLYCERSRASSSGSYASFHTSASATFSISGGGSSRMTGNVSGSGVPVTATPTSIEGIDPSTFPIPPPPSGSIAGSRRGSAASAAGGSVGHQLLAHSQSHSSSSHQRPFASAAALASSASTEAINTSSSTLPYPSTFPSPFAGFPTPASAFASPSSYSSTTTTTNMSSPTNTTAPSSTRYSNSTRASTWTFRSQNSALSVSAHCSPAAGTAPEAAAVAPDAPGSAFLQTGGAGEWNEAHARGAQQRGHGLEGAEYSIAHGLGITSDAPTSHRLRTDTAGSVDDPAVGAIATAGARDEAVVAISASLSHHRLPSWTGRMSNVSPLVLPGMKEHVHEHSDAKGAGNALPNATPAFSPLMASTSLPESASPPRCAVPATRPTQSTVSGPAQWPRPQLLRAKTEDEMMHPLHLQPQSQAQAQHHPAIPARRDSRAAAAAEGGVRSHSTNSTPACSRKESVTVAARVAVPSTGGAAWDQERPFADAAALSAAPVRKSSLRRGSGKQAQDTSTTAADAIEHQE
ncbi:hypothetical protein K437DRAFT_47020, partial [Tilletiaria anomala UBC 951]